jgi:hypothetical protein
MWGNVHYFETSSGQDWERCSWAFINHKRPKMTQRPRLRRFLGDGRFSSSHHGRRLCAQKSGEAVNPFVPFGGSKLGVLRARGVDGSRQDDKPGLRAEA